jgi:predicted nucleotidyltransferase
LHGPDATTIALIRRRALASLFFVRILEDRAQIARAVGEEAARCGWIDVCILFGSAARGRLRPDSDVDVGWLGPAAGADEATLRRRLGERLGREVHLVDLRRASELLRIEVVRTGSLCFERRPGSYTTFAAESMARWLEIAPAVQACAEAVRRRVLQLRESLHG